MGKAQDVPVKHSHPGILLWAWLTIAHRLQCLSIRCNAMPFSQPLPPPPPLE